MNQFQKVFKHLPEQQVIICIECQYAIQPNQIKGHLSTSHSSIPSPVRKAIEEFIQTLEYVAYEKTDVIYPDPDSGPMQGLPIYNDGLVCISEQSGSQCKFTCRAIKHMQKHCRENHNWVNSQKRGGNSRAKQQHSANRLWIDKQHCQRFFTQGAWQQYFQVMQEEEEEQEEFPEQTQIIVQKGERMLDKQLEEVEEAKRRRAIEADSNRYVANAWLKRTGWAKHLAGLDREQLVALLQPPIEGEKIGEEDEIEEGLIEACQATRRLIRKAHQCCRPEIVGLASLEYVNRRETGQKSSEKPFYAEQMPKTIKKYSGRWLKILCWIWRSQKQQEGRAKFSFTARQKRCMELIKKAANKENRIAAKIERGNKSRENSEDNSEQEEDSQNDSEQEENSDQEENPEKGWQKAKSETERACLEFWLALLDHQLKDDEYESAIISGLAGLGLDAISGGWMSALNYTPILSAIITVAKALVVYKAFQERQDEIGKLQKQGYGEEEAKSEAPAVVEGIRDMVKKFMTLTEFGGNPSPINWILRLRTYGMTIRYNTAEDGKIRWNGNEISFGRISFTMAMLRSMVHGLTATAREEMQEQLLLIASSPNQGKRWSEKLPKLEIGLLRDNPAEIIGGWNFLKDERNDLSVDGKRWLYSRILREAKLQKQFIEQERSIQQEERSVVWKRAAIKKYIRAVVQFKERLVVLVHITGGQPARGTEILSIQHSNSLNGIGSRGIFIEDGMVAFVTGYHKAFGSSGKVKVIHRFVPEEVGELVVYFMWLVQPLIEIFQGYQEDEKEFSEFLWEPRPELESDDEQEWADLNYRVDPEEEGGSDGSSNARGDMQGVRDPSIPRTSNPDGFWGTDRVRRALQKETYARMGVKVSIIAWRHICTAIIREASRDKKVHEVLDEEEAEAGSRSGQRGQKKGDQSDIRDLQAGHTSRIAGMIYGRDLMESPFHTITQRQGFRRVSIEWHRFLQFPSAWEREENDEIGSKLQMEEEDERREFQKWISIKKVDIHKQLKKLLGVDAEFRGIQEPVLKAIMERKSPIVAIMGTGAGKSVLFMLPASCSKNGVTIVVVPLISLREDLKDRCDKAQISCVEWSSKRPADWANIVLVTPEAAVGDEFASFIDRRRAIGQLDRIVVDECHVVLEASSGWRAQMVELANMTKKQAQLVYLTATLPPTDEEEFLKRMGLEREQVLMFRDRTVRRNVEYSVREYPGTEEDDEVKKLVDQKRQEYPLPGQIVVYCSKVDQAVRLGVVLGCPVYHRNIGSADEKRAVLSKLTGGKEQVFTATNALGLGIDAPSIRVVIHIGIRQKMRDYAQESGRAGRDGNRSEAIIMRKVWVDRDGKTKKDQGWNIEKSMKEFIEGENCRRIGLDRKMDGRVDRLGCEIGEIRCDICQGLPRGTRRHRVVVGNEEGRIWRRRGGVEGVDKEVEKEMEKEVGKGIEKEVEEETEQGTEEEIEELMGWTEARIAERGRVEEEDKVEMEIFREEQRSREWMQQRRIGIDIREGLEMADLEAKLEEWRGICVICKVKGGDGIGHQWQDCRRDETGVWVEYLGEIIERVGKGFQFEKYSGCFECGLPQSICDGWVEDTGRGPGRFKKRRGEKCQYSGILRTAVMAIIQLGDDEMIEWGRAECEARGISSEDAEVGLQKWLGARVKIGMVETNEMVRVFCKWA